MLDQTCTIDHRSPSAPADVYNNAALEVTGTDEAVACRFENTPSTELILGRDTVIDDGRLFLAPGTAIGRYDQVREISGLEAATWDVVGDPFRPHGFTEEMIVMAMLRATRG